MSTVRYDLSALCEFLDEQRQKLDALRESMKSSATALAVAGIEEGMDCVHEFHRRNTVSKTCRLTDMPEMEDGVKRLLIVIQSSIAASGLALMTYLHDQRALRSHLALEELAEWMQAILENDEQALLDAQADRLYVLFGDAVTFDLPLGEAFAEVHRSNMTKTKQPTDPHSQRLRSKGPDYVPPDLKTVLEQHRVLQEPRASAKECAAGIMDRIAEERAEQTAKGRAATTETLLEEAELAYEQAHRPGHPDMWGALALEWGVPRADVKTRAYQVAYSNPRDSGTKPMYEQLRDVCRAAFGLTLAERRAEQQKHATSIC